MNQEIRKKWLEALPKYKKGTGVLRENDAYCALGVLCELYRQEVGGKWLPSENGVWRFSTDGTFVRSSLAQLPVEVSNWAGVDESPLLKTPVALGSSEDLWTVVDVNDYSPDWAAVVKELEGDNVR